MFAKQSMHKLLTVQGSFRVQAASRVLLATRPALMAAAASSRAFATTVKDGAGKLNRALEKEIKYENEHYAQLEDIETFLNESGFKFSEEDQGIFMSLKKQVGNRLVEVTFEAR